MKKAQLASKNFLKPKRIRKNKKNYFRETSSKTEIRPTYTHTSSPFDLRYLILFSLLVGIFLVYTPLTFLLSKPPSIINLTAISQSISHIHISLPHVDIPAFHIKMPIIHRPTILLPSLGFLDPILQTITTSLNEMIRQQMLLWNYSLQLMQIAFSSTFTISWSILRASTSWILMDINPLPNVATLFSLIFLISGIVSTSLFRLSHTASLGFPALLHTSGVMATTFLHFCIAASATCYQILVLGITRIATYADEGAVSIAHGWTSIAILLQEKTPQALSLLGEFSSWILTNTVSGTIWFCSVFRDYCLIVAHLVAISSIWLWYILVIVSIVAARIIAFLAIHEFHAREIFYSVVDYWVIQLGLLTWNITMLIFSWMWFVITVIGNVVFFILVSIWHGIVFVAMAIKHWLDGIFGAIGWFFSQLYPAYAFITNNIAQSVTSLFGGMGSMFSATIHH